MARFRLAQPHYLDGRFLEAGTEVNYPEDFTVVNNNPKFGGPKLVLEVSMNVIPLDEAAEKIYEARMARVGRPDPTLALPGPPDPKKPVPGQGPQTPKSTEIVNLPGQGPRDIAGNVPGVKEAKEGLAPVEDGKK